MSTPTPNVARNALFCTSRRCTSSIPRVTSASRQAWAPAQLDWIVLRVWAGQQGTPHEELRRRAEGQAFEASMEDTQCEKVARLWQDVPTDTNARWAFGDTPRPPLQLNEHATVDLLIRGFRLDGAAIG